MKFEFLFYLFFSFFILFFQSSNYFNVHLLIRDIKINFIFILTIYAYTRYPANFSMLYAFIIGIVCDLFSNSLLGTYGISYLLSSVPLLLFFNLFLTTTMPLFLIYVTIASFLKAIILTIIAAFTFDFYLGYKYFEERALFEIIINALSAIPCFLILESVFRLIDHFKRKATTP